MVAPAREDVNKGILLKELSAALQDGAFQGVNSLSDLIGKLPMVYLVRHGETPANLEKRINPAPKHLPKHATISTSTAYPFDDAGEAGLTEKGYTQADAAAQQLSGSGISAVYVSPQERAYETGRVIASNLGVSEMQVCPNLREREFGPYAGVPIAEVQALCAQRNQSSADGCKPDELIGALSDDGHVTAHWFNQTPKYLGEDAGETWQKTRVRMTKEIVRILADAVSNHHENIALASHGDASRMLVAAVRGVGWRDVLEHQNDYVNTIQNGQVITFDMNQLLSELLAKQVNTKDEGIKL